MLPVNQGMYHAHFHHHQVKRLNQPCQPNEQKKITNLPGYMFDENMLNTTSMKKTTPKYIKFFDYPLPELLANHSTDPLQNTTRQDMSPSPNLSKEGRFTNHEMVIRRNGEKTILRPRQDLVLVNGFTPVVRPSSTFPSDQSAMSHSQVASSLSIINKMSTKKREQTPIIKTKPKDRYRVKYCNEGATLHKFNDSNQPQYNNLQDPTFIHLVKQALHSIIEEKNRLPPQPQPLMSILPEFHNPPPPVYISQPFTPPSEEPYFHRSFNHSSSFNEPTRIPPRCSILDNRHTESFHDLPPEQYCSFEQKPPPHGSFSQREHLCMPHERNYTHLTGYFFE